MSPTKHYFTFSTEWANRKRLCADCRRDYDAGEHIEITTLKPYTSYVCPSGHSSIWTGAYAPSSRTLRDHICSCGAEFVEEDTEQWEVSFEMQHPGSDYWALVRVVRSSHPAHQQHAGLLGLLAQGEPIRNVQLRQVAQS